MSPGFPISLCHIKWLLNPFNIPWEDHAFPQSSENLEHRNSPSPFTPQFVCQLFPTPSLLLLIHEPDILYHLFSSATLKDESRVGGRRVMSTWDFAGAVGDRRILKGTEHHPVTSQMICTRTHAFSPATEFLVIIIFVAKILNHRIITYCSWNKP